jgi:hypothetical protein
MCCFFSLRSEIGKANQLKEVSVALVGSVLLAEETPEVFASAVCECRRPLISGNKRKCRRQLCFVIEKSGKIFNLGGMKKNQELKGQGRNRRTVRLLVRLVNLTL